MTPHRIATVVCALVLGGGFLGCADPQPRPPAVADQLTLEEEIALGRAAAPTLERDAGGRLDNLAVQVYVRTVGQRVARATHLSDLPYRFMVLDTSGVSAMALPGGMVYVTRGLVERLESEGQLASVLAGQMAHLGAGHVRTALTRQFGLSKLRRAAAAGEVPPGAGASTEAAEAVAGALRDADWSGAECAEADRLGLDYLAAAGYNPSEMVACLLRTGADAARVADTRDAVRQKYPDRRGRVADEEYRREVLNRLTPP